MRLFAFVLGVLVFGPQVVLSAKFKFGFTGDVEQCQPVTINFSGVDNAKSTPVNLTLVPFEDHPFSIPLPESTTNSSGITVTFLPLKAGQLFVASLDDENGANSARVSDVFKVFSSPDSDNSCLPSSEPIPSFKLLNNSVSQCETFTVQYNSSSPPIVRSYEPRGGSSEMQFVSTNQVDSTATYVMQGNRGDEVVLMIFDSDNRSQGLTTNLLTIGGDASSSTACLSPDSPRNSEQPRPDGQQTTTSTSKGVIIGVSVGGGLLILMTIGAALYLIRDRRSKRRLAQMVFDPARLEKSVYPPDEKRVYTPDIDKRAYSPECSAQSLPYISTMDSAGFVRNPIYATTEKFSPTDSEFNKKNSISSWVTVGLARGQSHRSMSRGAARHSTINPYDIEQMLDYAQERLSPRAMSIQELGATTPRLQSSAPADAMSSDQASPPVAVQDHVSQPFLSPTDLSLPASPAIRRPPVALGSPASLSHPTSRFSTDTTLSKRGDSDERGIGAFPKPKLSSMHQSVASDSGDSWGNISSP